MPFTTTKTLLVLIVIFLAVPVHDQELKTDLPKHARQSETKPEKEIKVFTLQHQDAEAIRDTICELFETRDSSATKQIPVPGTIEITCSVDSRTNSVLVCGFPGDVNVIEDLIERIDVKKKTGAETTVFMLRNAPAKDVADSIQAWMKEKRAGVENPEQLVIVPELVSNSLIVTTSLDAELSDELEKTIKALDQAPDLVRINIVVKKTVDGEEHILSRPTVMTLDEHTGSITIGNDRESLTIELTPKMLRNEDRETTRISRIPSNDLGR